MNFATTITAAALVLASGSSFAGSWEGAWQSHDLNTAVYDKPATLVEPMGSANFTVSLDAFNRGNPDHRSHESDGIVSGISSDQGFASSLDEAYAGNPDHV